MTLIEQNFSRFPETDEREREPDGPWIAQDSDELCRHRVTKARCEAAAALFDALAEVMSGFDGTAAQIEDLMNIPEDARGAAAHFRDQAKAIETGIQESPSRAAEIVSMAMRSWATRSEVHLGKAEIAATRAADDVRACPVEPGAE